jgi:putative protein-disulfide isomerase
MEKPTLIYVYDPLCGWCYGFHPVMEKLARRFDGQLHIRVIGGGLATGENAQPIGEGYDYIPKASSQVEQTTGVSFGKNFMLLAEEGSYLYDSLPSCIAQTAINRLAPDYALTFAGRMQKALFSEGMDLNDSQTFTALLDDIPADPDTFLELFKDESIRAQTTDQFKWCEKMNAKAFPTLLLQIGEETGLMSRGYRPYDILESHLHHLLRNIGRLNRT